MASPYHVKMQDYHQFVFLIILDPDNLETTTESSCDCLKYFGEIILLEDLMYSQT